MKEFTFYSDPSHGWLKVSWKDLKELASSIVSEISSLSYKDEEYVYLEEDLDAFIFLNHLEEQGITYSIKEKFTEFDSPIRRKKPYC